MMRHTLALLIVAASACSAKSSALPEAQVGEAAAIHPVDNAYREKVIEFSAQMNPKGPATARAAYAAIDGGAESVEAQDLGGLAKARTWVDRFELFYEYKPLSNCVVTTIGPSSAALAKAQKALAASDAYENLLEDVKKLAGDEYTQLLSTMSPSPTDSERAAAAVQALLLRGQSDPERTAELTALSVSYAAAGTDGKCVASPKLMSIIKKKL
jgi:hypothetical protein